MKKEDIKDFVQSIIIGFILALVISLFIRPIKVVGQSMENTLSDGQRHLFLDKLILVKKYLKITI